MELICKLEESDKRKFIPKRVAKPAVSDLNIQSSACLTHCEVLNKVAGQALPAQCDSDNVMHEWLNCCGLKMRL